MPQWNLLVTEGHVRAARWRNAVPLLMAAAILAVFVGIAISAILPNATPSSRIVDAKRAFVDERRTAIFAFLQDKGIIQAAPTDAGRALTRETALPSIAALMAALTTTDRIPQSVVAQNAEAFWQGDWQPGKIHMVRKGRTVLIGYFMADAEAQSGTGQQPVLQRAFGILRRGPERQWVYYCLQIARARPCDQQAVDPALIPATMRSLVPSSAFDAEKTS